MPGNSPDLNIIENCWTIVKKEVAAINPSSMTDLIAVIKAAWIKITRNTVKNCQIQCLAGSS